MAKYKTKPSAMLLDFLAEHPDKQFTVAQIAENLGENSPALSTIYRNLCELEESGVISRSAFPGQRDNNFRYIGSPECRRSLHLQCKRCGSIIHAKESVATRIIGIIKNEESFNIDISDTVICGLCTSCFEGIV